MPKNKGKGGKNRKRGKNENIEDTKRELILKEHGQDYAQVIRMLGGGHVEVYCFADGKKRVCHIRGKMRKKIWINKSDIVLIGLRYFEDTRADVILRYQLDEARELQRLGLVPTNINFSETEPGGTFDTGTSDNIYFDEATSETETPPVTERKEEEEEEASSSGFEDELIESI